MMLISDKVTAVDLDTPEQAHCTIHHIKARSETTPPCAYGRAGRVTFPPLMPVVTVQRL